MEDVDIKPDFIYRYTQTLKSLGKYEASEKWM
jgi:hypothetical protein